MRGLVTGHQYRVMILLDQKKRQNLDYIPGKKKG